MKHQRLPSRVVYSLSPILAKLPSEIAEWAQAMLFEASETESAGKFVLWICGMSTTIVRMFVGYALHLGAASRPLAATCSALYFVCLASFVFFRLIVETFSAKIPLLWGSVCLSVGRCAALTVICLAVAVGIWYQRNSARYLAIGLTAVQLLATISTIKLGEDASLNFVKLCIDIAVIVLMSQRKLTIAFRARSPRFN